MSKRAFRGASAKFKGGESRDSTMLSLAYKMRGLRNLSDNATERAAARGAARRLAEWGGLKDCIVCGVKGLSSHREPHLAPCGGACAGLKWSAPRSAYFSAKIIGAKSRHRVIHRLVYCESCGPRPTPADPALLQQQMRQWRNWVISKLEKGESAL